MNDQLQRSILGALARHSMHRNIHQGGKGGGEGLIQFALGLMDCVLTAQYTVLDLNNLTDMETYMYGPGLPVYYGGPYIGSKEGYYAGLLIWHPPSLSLPCTSLHLTVPHGDLIWCTKASDESKWAKCYSTLSTTFCKDLGLG